LDKISPSSSVQPGLNPDLGHDASLSLDSKMSHQRQSWLHYTLVHDLFDEHASSDMLRLTSKRIQELITRSIPICAPGGHAIANNRTLKSFFTCEWRPAATPYLLGLAAAYVRAGYLDIHDSYLPHFDSPAPGFTFRGTVLQSAIEWRKPELVRLFLSLGADVSLVPINDLLIHRYHPDVSDGEAVERPQVMVSKGDVIAFAHGYFRPEDGILATLKAALMHQVISQLPEGDADHATRPVKPSRGRRASL
jgi:hypothetical protein